MADQNDLLPNQPISVGSDNNAPKADSQPKVSSPPPPPWIKTGERANSQEVVSQTNLQTSAKPPLTVPPAKTPQEPIAETKPSTNQSQQSQQPAPQSFSEPNSSGFPPSSFSTSSLENGGKAGIFKKMLFPLGVVLLIVAAVFIFIRFGLPLIKGNDSSKQSGQEAVGKGGKKIELVYWGLWEPKAVLETIINDYQQAHSGTTINYVQQSPKDYRERLQSALAAGEGPDLFRFHNTWVPMLASELDIAPKNLINLEEYFPVVSKDLTMGTEIVGVPLMFDGLGLYYNPQLFNAAGKTVPTTWEELRRTAIDMTVYDSVGKIQTAGIALGTTNNVDNFSDILGLMLLQNGANPANPNDELAQDTLKFYTVFATTDKVWDESLPASTYAFATGKVAMILAPSWRAFEVAEINPTFKFQIAEVPQLPGDPVSWASYWVEGVAKNSSNTKAAWDFLSYMSSDEVLKKLYTTTGNQRLFGEPYAKVLLAQTLENDPLVGAFAKQGKNAKSWYLASRTFDNGLNDRVIKYYEDAVNKVINGALPDEALMPTISGLQQIIQQYKLNVK